MKKLSFYILTNAYGFYINLLSYLYPKKSLEIAYRLFSNPRKGKFKHEKLPKTIQRAKVVKHQIEGFEFCSYVWEGTNPETILLCHGWESNASRWKKLLPYLEKTNKTIVAIDAPAHGFATGKEFNVPYYSKFLEEAIKIYKPKIGIGHSIGGNALIYFQQHFEHTFNKIVILGSPSDFTIILNNFFSMLKLNKRVQNIMKNYIKNKFNIIADDFKVAEFLKNSDVEGIIAHDEDDSIVPISEAEKYVNNWNKARFIKTKGNGHSLHNSDLYREIQKFVE